MRRRWWALRGTRATRRRAAVAAAAAAAAVVAPAATTRTGRAPVYPHVTTDAVRGRAGGRQWRRRAPGSEQQRSGRRRRRGRRRAPRHGRRPAAARTPTPDVAVALQWTRRWRRRRRWCCAARRRAAGFWRGRRTHPMDGRRPRHSNLMDRQCTPPAAVAAPRDSGFRTSGGRWLALREVNEFHLVSQRCSRTYRLRGALASGGAWPGVALLTVERARPTARRVRLQRLHRRRRARCALSQSLRWVVSSEACLTAQHPRRAVPAGYNPHSGVTRADGAEDGGVPSWLLCASGAQPGAMNRDCCQPRTTGFVVREGGDQLRTCVSACSCRNFSSSASIQGAGGWARWHTRWPPC